MKIARLVCARKLPDTQELIKAFDNLPPSDIVITPGGLLKYQMPHSIKTVRGWNSTEQSLHIMTAYAESQMDLAPLLQSMRSAARHVTLGVDVYYDKPQDTAAELIALVDTDAGEIIHWTGN